MQTKKIEDIKTRLTHTYLQCHVLSESVLDNHRGQGGQDPKQERHVVEGEEDAADRGHGEEGVVAPDAVINFSEIR